MFKKSRVMSMKKHEEIVGTSYALIPIFGILLFAIVPLIFSLIMSFSELPNFSIKSLKFLGTDKMLDNYVNVLTDPLFYKSILNTLLASLSLIFSMVIGLLLAVLLNSKIKGTRTFRTIYFIPYVCSIVALTLMWRTMLDKNFGIINEFLHFFGVEPIAWLTDSNFFMIGMILMGTWCGIGFNLIMYSASLTNINPSYYDAAEIDGANSVQKFFHITLPILSPITFYLLIVGVIGSLQEFTRFQAINAVNSHLISPTGPDNSGLTIVFYLYNKAFNQIGGLGQAAATSWLLAIITIILTLVNFKLSKKWVNYC